MHLKNFSLFNRPGIGYILTPAYDMLATTLVNPEDKEELALTLNGKKRNIRRNDFTTAFKIIKLDEKQQRNIFDKFDKAILRWNDLIDTSFLDNKMKDAYKELVKNKHKRIAEE
jgi:serine/threonine-protein kinase HipA